MLLADRRLWILAAAALAVRVLVGLDLWRADPMVRILHSDPAYYDAWARALAEGTPFLEGRPFWLPPLYPWLLAPLYGMTGGGLGATIALQLALGVLWTLLVVRLADLVLERRAALAAGWLWTLYAPVVFFESRLLAVNAAVPLCLLALILFVRARAGTERALLLAAGAGLASGVAAMARPNLLLAAPAVALALAVAFRSDRRRAVLAVVAVGLGAAAGIAPSALHNSRATGELVPVTANGGVNFWFGNNEHARGTFHAPSVEWGSIEAQRDVSVSIASQARGAAKPLSEGEASAYWFERGRTWLFENPGDALALWGRKLGDSLSSTEFGIQYFPTVTRRLAPSLWLLALPFGALLALGALGWSGEARGRDVLVAWLVAGFAASLLYFTYSRFRIPLLLAWMPFAGRGLVRVIDAVRGKGPAPSAAAIALAVLLLGQSFVPFEGGYPRQLAANALVDAGASAAALGDPERGRELLELALEDVPINPRARTELGRIASTLGRDREAYQQYREAFAMPGAYSPALLGLVQLEIASADPTVRNPAAGVERARAWLATASFDPLRHDVTVWLATALIDSPTLAADAGEARTLVDRVLAEVPTHPAANQVRAYLDAQ